MPASLRLRLRSGSAPERRRALSPSEGARDSADDDEGEEPVDTSRAAAAADGGAVQSAPSGAGLGLTICRSIADANGWQLSLRTVADGVETEVVFPRRRTA